MRSGIRVFIFIALFTAFFDGKIFAAGDYCCQAGLTYDTSTDKCTRQNPRVERDPLECSEGEQCVGEDGGGPSRGICTEEDQIIDCSCPNGTQLRADGLCHYAPQSKLQPEIPICKSGTWCKALGNNIGFCVKGNDVTVPVFDLCKRLPDPAKTECMTCLGNDDTNRGVYTALGCIHTNPKVFIEDFLKIALGIAGGIALLLMIYGAFLTTTSAGDPKKADEGREYITGTIAGLLFIIFSIVLLKIIGVEIFQIPGL